MIGKIDKELIRVYIEFENKKIKMKLPYDTKIFYLRQYIKRTVKITSKESLYLFSLDSKQLMMLSKNIGDYAGEPTCKDTEDNPKKEKVVTIVIRKTDTF